MTKWESAPARCVAQLSPAEGAFVAMREARDAKLAAPLLLLPSIQVNIRAGKLPPAESNDIHYLKIPVQLVS